VSGHHRDTGAVPDPNRRSVTLSWEAGERFRGGRPGGPEVVVDGDGLAGASPMESLLLAAAGCTGADVVTMLVKMRVEVTKCRLTITGIRRPEPPRRYVSLHFAYEIGGERLDETKARRAIDLSMGKYCSVLHSLAADIATDYSLVLL